MAFRRFALVIYQFLAYGLALGVLFLVGLTGVSRFSTLQGERTFYLFSPSSQAERTHTLSLKDLGNIRGESVEAEGKTAGEIIEELNATLLFIEEAAGVRSYYCFTEQWADGLRIGEYFVNLHIVERESGCVVGAPIIFGGF